jgi:hypothetical protein
LIYLPGRLLLHYYFQRELFKLQSKEAPPVMLFRAAIHAHATSSNMTNPAEQAKADLAGYHSTLSFIQLDSLRALVHCAVCVV